MIAQWRRKRKALKNAQYDLCEYVHANFPEDSSLKPEDYRIWTAATKLSPQTSLDTLIFLQERISRYPDIAEPMSKVMNRYFHLEERLLNVMAHFDFASELGWEGATDVMELTLTVLPGHDHDYTVEQAQALIRLEDARWGKQHIDGTIARTLVRPEEFHDCVTEALLDNPADAVRIVELAKGHRIEHAEHLQTLLKGEIAAPLAEGML